MSYLGDLNFTVSAREIWGVRARLDPLSDFFTSMINDACIGSISPTWQNGRIGDANILKGLDRFLIARILAKSVAGNHLWISSEPVFDHVPTILQIEPNM